MSQSLYTAKMGIKAQQARLDILGNNIANVNTIGFKNVRTDFKDALYQTLRRPVQPQDDLNLELGHGVLVASTTRDFTEGSIQVTGNVTDLALTDEGFFSILNPDGSIEYTRNGALALSKEADGNYLVTGNGAYVLDPQGNRIRIEGSTADLVISQEGAISQADGEPYAQLGLFTFNNLKGLEALQNSNFKPTVASGDPIAITGQPLVRQGALEMSNVELANEMTRLIRTQRAFQLNSRALTTADQMMGIANNMRRA